MSKINQKTIKDIIILKGIGLHNGIEMKFEDQAIRSKYWNVFKRIDIENKNLISADFKNVVRQFYVQN